MKGASLGSLWLRLRVALARMNPVLVVATLLMLACVASLAWLGAARMRVAEDYDAARLAAARPAPPPPPPAAPGADQNLAHFYAALGQRRGVERQLKELFALAARHGLVLRQGEYRAGQDRAGGFTTYQVNLPVKGRYGAIWAFAFDTLRALPHASLDDVSFRRDAIGEENVEARLRLTLYLSGAAR
ncbi:hypothetical protein LQ564_21650 [Massilia sp. G4R7]|uniref:Transmembrane protein n=1 Tax=Massilia phyllostachyos TaxID=2898585 RepID=A0ABS8QAX3_9BURK|nr:hypothetical protein [Massilia phyllostachyos]MCD2518908.1 hypothetical protein [Massilia phyllostachyos]